MGVGEKIAIKRSDAKRLANDAIVQYLVEEEDDGDSFPALGALNLYTSHQWYVMIFFLTNK